MLLNLSALMMAYISQFIFVITVKIIACKINIIILSDYNPKHSVSSVRASLKEIEKQFTESLESW